MPNNLKIPVVPSDLLGSDKRDAVSRFFGLGMLWDEPVLIRPQLYNNGDSQLDSDPGSLVATSRPWVDALVK